MTCKVVMHVKKFNKHFWLKAKLYDQEYLFNIGQVTFSKITIVEWFYPRKRS